MTADQIKLLQQMVIDRDATIEQLIADKVALLDKVNIPRDMQQEANLIAVEKAKEAWEGRVKYLEGEVYLRDAWLKKAHDELAELKKPKGFWKRVFGGGK